MKKIRLSNKKMLLPLKCHKASVKQASLSAVKLLKPMPSNIHHIKTRYPFCYTSLWSSLLLALASMSGELRLWWNSE